MDKNSITIRRVTPSDIEALLKLHDIVWPDVDYDKRAKAHFMLEESDGVGYCAETEGRLIGSHLSILQNFYYGDRKLRCVETGDTCVDPSCQGLGLFQKIYNAFRRDFFDCEKGELIWGISAPGAVRSFTKAGKQFIDTTLKLRKFGQPLRTIIKTRCNIKKISSPIVWDKKNDVKVIDPVLLVAREEIMEKNKLLHQKYDQEILNWRMKSNSGIKSFFEPELGYILYKKGHRNQIVELGIGEVFLYDYTPSAFKKLIKHFQNKLNPDIMWVVVSEGHPLRNFYRNCGFWVNPRKKYLPHCVLAETEEMKEIGYKPMNWAISSLDVDTF